ncbi:MAG TPA: nucleotide exchange factor GrpE [Candidatus Polarisedimenticolaceae bacterium]|nr:nucleotide exchange factor GrpE [Candidatus Polarisedimenticolaceae bacterium]
MPIDPARRIPPDQEGTDDIEILEVVSVDENGEEIRDVPEEAASEDDVELVFEEPAESDTPPEPDRRDEEIRDLRDRLVRLQADFENFKKRGERERLDHLRYATSDLVARILPVLDNFERALLSVRPGGTADAVVEGIGLIHRQLLQILEKEGLRAMDSVGATFDPALHEAVATDPDPSAPPHTVTQVFQRGYFLHDRLVRPAMVRVRIGGDDDGDPGDRRES